LRRIARKRGGVLLSKCYVNNREPLRWQCGAGHVWQAPAESIKPSRFRKGTWCPLCLRRSKGKPARLSIEEMRQLARERGGKCLSAVHTKGQTKLRWRCEDGHEWDAEPAAVKYGTWCPTCAGTKKLTLEALRAVAEKRGGKLLSSEYHNLQSPLTWECADGHQ